MYPVMREMRTWVAYIFFCFLFICAGSAFAQDAGMSDVETVSERDAGEGDKAVLGPGDMEARYIPRASGVYAPNDSIALQLQDFPMQQATQKSAERSTEKQAAKPKDDSILTFNFLYYIIQKYKLQDIID